MTTVINHYSVLFAAALILGLTAYGLLRDGFTPRDGIILALVAAGLILTWWYIRPAAGEKSAQARLNAHLGRGTPVLLELQSPY